MRTLFKLIGVLSLAILALGVRSAPAYADPLNSPQAVFFGITCEGERFSVVSPNEPAANLLIIGETTVGVATVASVTTTFTDPQTGELVSLVQEVVFGPGHGQAQGVAGKLTHCSETVVTEDADLGTITAVLEGDFLLTPRP